MRTIVLILIFLLAARCFISAQITSPIKPGNFGVDGDVDAGLYSGLSNTGVDDWFKKTALGTSLFVIDTTGAAALMAQYLANPATRLNSYYRTMSHPVFGIYNNRLWLDALWVRDYHGQDSTVFGSGATKNGMSPAIWSGTPYNSVPDKNDILDIFMHIRRQGPNSTDSLWMFGGISMDNVTGDRYFDFEMYQTDIYYDRASLSWYGYGPDAGHTSWTFDASGNVLTPGDIIFSGAFQSGTLTNIEARIWVSRATWHTVTPVAFNWGGNFDGNGSGSVYGYASISPKLAGDYYAGMASGNNTWSGPFGLVLQDNSLQYSNPGPASATNGYYVKDQLIEFAVNLSKLGLDPVGSGSGDICGTPFNRLVVKTRSSQSFTAQLKDFVAPTDLFLAPRADVAADIPLFCGAISVSTILVQNPYPSSDYTWSTTDGHIVGPASGTSIIVDSPGTYMVTQRLSAGCNPYAYDTMTIVYDPNCGILDQNTLNLRGVIHDKITQLKWTTEQNNDVSYFDIERSYDGNSFDFISRVYPDSEIHQQSMSYTAYDNLEHVQVHPSLYYRLKLRKKNSSLSYSKTIHLPFGSSVTNISISPNPVHSIMTVNVNTVANDLMNLFIYDIQGKVVHKMQSALQAGMNMITVDDFSRLQTGMYLVVASTSSEVFKQKIILTK